MTFGIFEEIEKLIEYMPIDADIRLMAGLQRACQLTYTSIYDNDGVTTRFRVIKPGTNSVSFREIVKLSNKIFERCKGSRISGKKKYAKNM